MWRNIAAFELQSIFSRPLFYFFWMVFLLFSLIMILGNGGYFEQSDNTPETIRYVNSPYEITAHFIFLSKYLIFIVPVFLGMILFKDFSSRIFMILYSYPIRKKSYLAGKLVGYIVPIILIAITLGLTYWLSIVIIGKSSPSVGPQNLSVYLSSIGSLMIPNILIASNLVVACLLITRNGYIGFMIIILLFLFQFIVNNTFPNHTQLLSLLDPFGQNAFQLETRYWTFQEKNLLTIPNTGNILWNRIFWLGITSILCILSLRKFKLNHHPPLVFQFRKRSKTIQAKTYDPEIASSVFPRLGFNPIDKIKTLWNLSSLEFLWVLRKKQFYMFLAMGVLAILFAISRVTIHGSLRLLPVTRLMLEIPAYFYTSFVIIFSFIVIGSMIHKDRRISFDQLVNSTPVSNGIHIGAKLLAITKIQVLLLGCLMVVGILIQITNGYYHIEFSHYLFQLFVLTLPNLLVWSMTAIFIFTLLPNYYLALFTLIIIWIGKDQLHHIGLDYLIFQFNRQPVITQSDLSGYGHLLEGYHLLNLYWLSVGLVILLITLLITKRYFSYSWKKRLQGIIHGITFRNGILFILLLSIAVYLGSQIKQIESRAVVHHGLKEKLEIHQAKFKAFEELALPRINNIYGRIELYPKENSMHIEGYYTLYNPTLKNIDTILIRTGFDELTTFSLDRPNQVLVIDTIFKAYALQLNKPLLPNDSIRLHFKIRNRANTLFQTNSNVKSNGTFLRTDIFPRLGTHGERGIQNPMDSSFTNSNYYGRDAHLLHTHFIIGTQKDQQAFAPGRLVKSWENKGRKYYEYKTEQKIKLSIGILSGAYDVHQDQINNVNLFINHYNKHVSVLPEMMEGLKDAIEYNEHHFSKYPYSDATIVEFPLTEGTYATAMANIMPTSEQRFILAPTASHDISLAYYVPAHEITHLWWGHQLMPANAKGATMLTESITEYITLNLYRQQFGDEKATQFLKKQHERYLQGRSYAKRKENPLFLVQPEQDHIAYGKGAIAFNTLRHFWSEDSLNTVLAEFLQDYRNGEVYPTSVNLLDRLANRIPTQFQYLIRDYFQTITLHSPQINSVQKAPLHNQWQIDIGLGLVKQNDLSEEQEIHDAIELAFYDEFDKIVHRETVWQFSNLANHQFILNFNPSKIVIDPDFLLICTDRQNLEHKF